MEILGESFYETIERFIDSLYKIIAAALALIGFKGFGDDSDDSNTQTD